MAERTGRGFAQRPTIRDSCPPRGADLVVAKTRVHARDRVVPRDVVAADQPEQPAAGEREARATRLAANERVRAGRDSAEQAREPLGLEVMDK